MTKTIFKLTDTPRWTEVFSDTALGVACHTGPLPVDAGDFAAGYVFGQLRTGTLVLPGCDRVVQPGEIFGLEPGQATGWQPSLDASAYLMVRRDDSTAQGEPVVVSRADLTD